ncbi:MAG: DUF4382 domain-containing protein [Deltaproteobacteria bacterium]|nr:DUF4382 domain-containing protein [Deltaproteobacteria bacterium]
MTRKRVFKSLLAVLVVVFLIGCEVSFFVAFNGGTSKLFVRVTDAKPALPHGVEAVFITFEEFFVHKDGGKWYSLPLFQTPYSVDLLKLQAGRTTTLVQPASLAPGTYDRIRVSISSAAVLSDGRFYAVAIPSGNLVIEKGFCFDLRDGRTMDLTIDFDLSQSLAATGSLSAYSYELNPVLHINNTEEAAAIRGEIAPETFAEYDTTEAMVTVFMDKDLSGGFSTGDEEYTRIVVVEDNPAFSIFWLVPEQGYTVQIEMDPTGPPAFEQFIFPADLQKGATFLLNQSSLI